MRGYSLRDRCAMVKSLVPRALRVPVLLRRGRLHLGLLPRRERGPVLLRQSEPRGGLWARSTRRRFASEKYRRRRCAGSAAIHASRGCNRLLCFRLEGGKKRE